MIDITAITWGQIFWIGFVETWGVYVASIPLYIFVALFKD